VSALRDGRGPAAALAAIFFLSGVAALVYQICWQRMLFVSFGIDIESVTIIVSTFMLGLGAGALAGGWIADRFPARLLVLFAACELAIGLFGLASASSIRAVGDMFVQFPRPVVALVNFVLLLAPTSLMGATLPILVTDAVRRHGGIGVSVGRLYFFNTLGASAGALFIAMGAFRYVDLATSIQGAAAVNFCVAALGALLAWKSR
jgi:predicted membrane-bound spermidine synthase